MSAYQEVGPCPSKTGVGPIPESGACPAAVATIKRHRRGPNSQEATTLCRRIHSAAEIVCSPFDGCGLSAKMHLTTKQPVSCGCGCQVGLAYDFSRYVGQRSAMKGHIDARDIRNTTSLFFFVASLQLMSNHQNQYQVLSGHPTIFGHVAEAAPRQY
jgi:hypothetical protein